MLDASAQGVQGQLWAYRRGPRGYTTSPRLLPWGNGMPRGSMTLVSGMGKGELLVTVGGMPFLVWPGGHRPAAKVAMPGSGQLNAVGTVWRHTGVPTTILLLNGPKREIDALRVGNRAALPALHFTAPAGYRGPWRAITGDAQSRPCLPARRGKSCLRATYALIMGQRLIDPDTCLKDAAQQAAINGQSDPRDVGGGIGTEEGDGVTHVRWIANIA